ncbi:MAG TPA: hypothetical protein VLH40_07595 [Atribacteraceae bacterium]|nr:hypothetical protein [Atribacteraceae bacterium]
MEVEAETFDRLEQLRAFRYFFRHAYRKEIETNRLRAVLDSANTLRPLYEPDIARFFASLEVEEP